jgi:hypothetical protein
MNRNDVKIVADSVVGPDAVSVRPPFKMRKDGLRRYIRLEISEPVTFTVLKDKNGRFSPGGERPIYSGSILNISAGGALLISENPAEEGTVIFLQMSLQGIEILDHIVGVVKRAEMDAGDWLIGVEFVSRDGLSDLMSEAEIAVLPENAASFDERVKAVLNKYIFYRKVAKENQRDDA